MQGQRRKKICFLALVCILLSLFVAMMLFTSNNVIYQAYAEDNLQSQLAERNCISYVKELGISIPEEFTDSDNLEPLIRDIIESVKDNSNAIFPYSYSTTLDFAEEIKSAIHSEGNSAEQNLSTPTRYTLQDSTLYSNSGWLNYNCYAYSIQRDENPPEYSTIKQYQPGDFSGEPFSVSLDIDEMAMVVESDLQALGCYDISTYSYIPSVETWESLICIRKGSWDYHFMRYDQTTDEWFHKPGFTAILKYNYEPSNDRIWIGEYVDSSGVAHYSSGLTYDSDIYFIKYTAPESAEVFNNFGYSDDTYYWYGDVIMKYHPTGAVVSTNTVKVIGDTKLDFKLYTTSCTNSLVAINGTIEFQLENSSGTVLQTHTSTVSISTTSHVLITDESFSINPNVLPNGVYTLILSSQFQRGNETNSETLSYSIIVNDKPLEVLSNFGFESGRFKWKGKVELTSDYLYSFSYNSSNVLVINRSTDLVFKLGTKSVYNAWHAINGTVVYELKNSSNETIQIEGNDTFTSTFRVGLLSNVSFTNRSFTINTGSLSNDTYTLSLSCTATRNGTTKYSSALFTFKVNRSCIAEGSLISLADGSQVAVEDLTGNENLLVWNMLTGQFDSAPILFIDSDPVYSYEVIKLTFSDGTEVKVIDEHAFFDMTLGEYVFLRRDAAQYIGHYFNKKSGNTWTTVQLTSVAISTESTTAWSPVTYGHLCYYVNGMLSMPGATEGLINIFDVDTSLMKYDPVQMAADIQTYGLYTYAEFNAIIPLPEYVFNAFNGQYLKVSIGKGLITLNEIAALLERYAIFFN